MTSFVAKIELLRIDIPQGGIVDINIVDSIIFDCHRHHKMFVISPEVANILKKHIHE